jgi:hypothetical protein
MPATPEQHAAPGRSSPIPVLLRFISCGLLAIALGVLWRFTLAPSRVGVGSAFAGIFFLLLGFIIGGIGWYVRDVRVRARNVARVSDEQLVFSFVVFAAMPFAVLLVIGVIWLIAFIIGAS